MKTIESDKAFRTAEVIGRNEGYMAAVLAQGFTMNENDMPGFAHVCKIGKWFSVARFFSCGHADGFSRRWVMTGRGWAEWPQGSELPTDICRLVASES